MTASIRLPIKSARWLLGVIESTPAYSGIPVFARAAEDIRRELTPKPRSAAKKKTAAKRRSKSAELKVIRAIVFARAYGRCELDCGSPPTELHHAFGRVRVRQSAKNCLALCARCHRILTLALGGARACWDDVAQKFDRLGFTDSATRAYALRDKAQAKADLAKGLG